MHKRIGTPPCTLRQPWVSVAVNTLQQCFPVLYFSMTPKIKQVKFIFFYNFSTVKSPHFCNSASLYLSLDQRSGAGSDYPGLETSIQGTGTCTFSPALHSTAHTNCRNTTKQAIPKNPDKHRLVKMFFKACQIFFIYMTQLQIEGEGLIQAL